MCVTTPPEDASRFWNILGMEFSSFHSCDPSGFYAFEGGLKTYLDSRRWEPNTSGMKALVTGGNRGIGLELCRQLAKSRYDVIAACRKSSDELSKLNCEVVEGIDVTDAAALETLRNALDAKLDLLVSNAGILGHEKLDDLDCESLVHQFEVNAVGPLRLVSKLLPVLGRGSKVALVTSRMGSLADNTSGGRYGYRMSKAALNMAGVSLAHDLKNRGVSVAILHPGYVQTDMTDQQGSVAPAEAAAGLLQRIEELTLEKSGSFWHANGERLPW